MAVSTILILVKHATARLLQNKKNQPFVLFLMNLLPAQRLQHYINSKHSIYTRSGVVMMLTSGMPHLNFKNTRKKYGSYIHTSGSYYTHGLPQIFTASDEHRMITHTRCRARTCVIAQRLKRFITRNFFSQLNRILKTEPAPLNSIF